MKNYNSNYIDYLFLEWCNNFSCLPFFGSGLTSIIPIEMRRKKKNKTRKKTLPLPLSLDPSDVWVAPPILRYYNYSGSSLFSGILYMITIPYSNNKSLLTDIYHSQLDQQDYDRLQCPLWFDHINTFLWYY